jgi:hypothetical protein
MESYLKILNAVKLVGGSFLTIGTAIFLFGFFASNSLAMGVGLGAAIGAIFIFIMGVFFVATEEMLANTDKGIIIASPRENKNVIPFKLK